jgi:hypothetical protein
MLRSNRFADILATLIMSCFALMGWINLHQEYSLQSKKMISAESKLPNFLTTKLAETTIAQYFKAQFLP